MYSGSEVKIFERLFIADLKSDGQKKKVGREMQQGKRVSGKT